MAGARDGSHQMVYSIERVWFVNLVRDQNILVAATKGEIFCLDPIDGHILWNNGLKGAGYGIATIVAGDSQQGAAALAQQVEQEQKKAAANTA